MSINIESIFGEDFDKLMSRLMKEWEVPGMSIAIIPDNSAPTFKSYGTSHDVKPFTSEVSKCPSLHEAD